MDTAEAIKFHTELRYRLEQFLSTKHAASFELFAIGTENVCKMGLWLGPEHKRGEHTTLFRLHKEFHDLAGRVVRLIMSTQYEAARRMLDNEYTAVEQRLLSTLDEMHRGVVRE
jgi:hypothetical protein